MLLDTISYENEFPFVLNIVNIREYPIHYHEDMEILYILKGSALLKNGCVTHTMQEGDIFIVDAGFVHGVRAIGGSNVVASIHVSNEFFHKYFPEVQVGIYRTRSDRKQNPDQGYLQELLLQFIVTLLNRQSDYKASCINMFVNIMNLLESKFKLFAVKDGHIQPLDRSNPTVEARLRAVVNYIQRNLTSKLSLGSLAKAEGLSSYYLSHIISDNLGISFRDLIGLIRVLSSERMLLLPENRISTVARKVGFSTSRYYEEAFQRWYRCSPEEFRRFYLHMRLDISNPADVEYLTLKQAAEITRLNEFQTIARNRRIQQPELNQEQISYSTDMQAIRTVREEVTLEITCQDYEVMRRHLLQIIDSMNCKHLIIRQMPSDSPEDVEQLRQVLTDLHFQVDQILPAEPVPSRLHGYDTLIGSIYQLLEHLNLGRSQTTVQVRSQGDPSEILKGERALFTSSQAQMPLYRTLNILANYPGKLLKLGKRHALIQLDGTLPAYMIIAYNYSDTLLSFCRKPCSLQQVDQAIRNFHDELNIHIDMEIPRGEYIVNRYRFSNYGSVFDLMSFLHFPDRLSVEHDPRIGLGTVPLVEASSVSVEDSFQTSITIRGLGVQILMFQQFHR